MSWGRLRSSGLAVAIVFIVTITTFASIPAQPAEAYRPYICNYHDAVIGYFFASAVKNNTAYSDAAKGAVSAWTNLTEATLYSTTSPELTIDAVNSGNQDFDARFYYDGCNRTTSVWIGDTFAIWNRFDTDAYSVNAKKSVIVHEIGHGLGLDHTGSSSCAGQPIMYGSNSRWFTCGHVNPQQDDINGIAATY